MQRVGKKMWLALKCDKQQGGQASAKGGEINRKWEKDSGEGKG